MAKVKVVLIDGVRHVWDPFKKEAIEIVKLTPEEREAELIAELAEKESDKNEEIQDVKKVGRKKAGRKTSKEVDVL